MQDREFTFIEATGPDSMRVRVNVTSNVCTVTFEAIEGRGPYPASITGAIESVSSPSPSTSVSASPSTSASASPSVSASASPSASPSKSPSASPSTSASSSPS